MLIYIDENLSPHLSRALNELEKHKGNVSKVVVKCIQDEYKKGLKDFEIIPMLGKQNALWITQDKSILKNKIERNLILEYSIVLFILSPSWSKRRYWEKVKLIINVWEEIKSLGVNPRPFVFRINGNGKIVKEQI